MLSHVMRGLSYIRVLGCLVVPLLRLAKYHAFFMVAVSGTKWPKHIYHEKRNYHCCFGGPFWMSKERQFSCPGLHHLQDLQPGKARWHL